MNRRHRLVVGLVGVAAAASLAAGCGEPGSSGTDQPPGAGNSSLAAGPGCAPIAGDQLVVLDDDKKLQNSDNIVPAVNAKASSPQLLDALNKVSAVLDEPALIGLNKATDIDHTSSKVAAKKFADSHDLTSGIEQGSGGDIVIGAANFSESQTLAELYKIVLTAAGFHATTQTIGNRELYEPALEKGKIQVVPEYAATLAEFINPKVNGADAAPVASPDIDKTMAALRSLGDKVGLTFGEPAKATDQNAFAVTKAFAGQHGLTTLSDFAAKCSGAATILGGPPECPKRPYCQEGLEGTYGISFGQFKSLDAAGPLTKKALTGGTISIGLVLSSDPALASG